MQTLLPLFICTFCQMDLMSFVKLIIPQLSYLEVHKLSTLVNIGHGQPDLTVCKRKDRTIG